MSARLKRRCLDCPRTTYDSRCPDCARARQRARDQARADDPIRQFRRSQAWIRFAREYRAAHPDVCARCGATGRLTVGHRIPLAELLRIGRLDLALDWSNLQVECVPCQNRQGHQQRVSF